MFRTITKMGLAAMALLVGLPLAGCTSTGVSSLPPTPRTSAQTVYELKAGLVAAEIAAQGYENTACANVTPCTAAGAVALNKAIISADALINTAETAVRAGTSSDSAISAAQAALSALQTLVTQYASSSASTAS
jgi:hypothetical protein